MYIQPGTVCIWNLLSLCRDCCQKVLIFDPCSRNCSSIAAGKTLLFSFLFSGGLKAKSGGDIETETHPRKNLSANVTGDNRLW